MSIEITATGIGCIGVVIGYILFYSFKRHHQPITPKPLPVTQLLTILVAISASGVVGKAFLDLRNINYIGPYGIGLLIGVAIEVILTMIYENPFALSK